MSQPMGVEQQENSVKLHPKQRKLQPFKAAFIAHSSPCPCRLGCGLYLCCKLHPCPAKQTAVCRLVTLLLLNHRVLTVAAQRTQLLMHLDVLCLVSPGQVLLGHPVASLLGAHPDQREHTQHGLSAA